MIEVLTTIIALCQINIGHNNLGFTDIESLTRNKRSCQAELAKCLKSKKFEGNYEKQIKLLKCISKRR